MKEKRLEIVDKDSVWYPKEFVEWLFRQDIWTDCTGLEPVTQIEINDTVYSIAEAFKYWESLTPPE